MKKCDINIYVNNHGRKDGIEDYISLFQAIFSRHNYRCQVSNRYEPGIPNIIIEEFTNYLENQKLEQFREHNPGTPLILVLTEFMEIKWGVRALNHFGGIVDSCLLALMNPILMNRRKDLPSPRLGDWLKVVLFSPVLLALAIYQGALYGLRRIIPFVRWGRGEPIRTRISKVCYWRLRYLGLMQHLDKFDKILCSHEEIWPQMIKNRAVNKTDNRFVGVVYPEFDVQKVIGHLFVDKKNKLEITGSTTPYRQKWAEKVNFQILSYGLHHVIDMVEVIPWGDHNPDRERASYSLHPPQTKNWPYSSPTRIYRALSEDGNIPVITRHFGQNPIEDVCLVYTGIDTLAQMIDFWEHHYRACEQVGKRMQAYNAAVEIKNNIMMSNILG